MTISTDTSKESSEPFTLGVEFNRAIKRRLDAGEDIRTSNIFAACMSIMTAYIESIPAENRLSTVDRLFAAFRGFAEKSLQGLSS